MVSNDNIQSRHKSSNQPEKDKEIQEITKESQQNQQENTENRQISILMSFNSWKDLLNTLNPQDYFLTKEDFEVIRSWITSKNANIEANIIEFLRTASNNPNSIRKLLQFIVIRKIGNILFQEYNAKLEALKFMLDKQTSLAIALVNAISSLASLIPSVSFNFIANAKWIGMQAILVSAYTATVIEIGNIKNNIRQLLQENAFCIKLCSDTSLNMLFKDVTDSNKFYNEGILLAKDTNNIYNALESLFNKEIDKFIKTEIDTNNDDSKNNTNKGDTRPNTSNTSNNQNNITRKKRGRPRKIEKDSRQVL